MRDMAKGKREIRDDNNSGWTWILSVHFPLYGRLGGSSLKNNESPLSVQFDKFEALLDRTTHSSILPSNSSSASTLRSSYTVHFAGILVFAFFFLSPESGCFQFWCKLAMDHEPYDSSGTDDDFPPTHQNRIPRGAHLAGNGSAVGSIPYARMYGEIDMETQIHQLEKEAYSSVLRAFKAQADVITWEKESLTTELRKELRLSNEELRELLGHVNADDVIQNIREWRQAGGNQLGVLSFGQAIHDSIPSPPISASRKKQKITPSALSQSFGGPSPFHPQSVDAPVQSSLVEKRGPVSGSKGKKHKPGHALPGVSSIKQYPSSGLGGRNQVPNRVTSGTVMGELAEGASLDSLVGRRMSPADIQWVGEDPGVNRRQGFGGSGNGMRRSVGRGSVPGVGKGRGTAKGQSRKDFLPSQNGIGMKTPDDIQILHTDTLVKEVERVFNAKHPDALEIEQVKKVLKDHEQALIDAIARLADLSDGESDEGGFHFSHATAMAH
ncbi:Protein EMSY-LIKE 3 [Glycine max]|nr:Protein EMSY-LIKE 3 [Glycine max]